MEDNKASNCSTNIIATLKTNRRAWRHGSGAKVLVLKAQKLEVGLQNLSKTSWSWRGVFVILGYETWKQAGSWGSLADQPA